MYYNLDEEGKINAISEEKFSDDAVWTDEEIIFDYNGRLVFKKDTENEEYRKIAKIKEQEQLVSSLRYKREIECFSVINRGQLWYDTLTEEQKTELKVWYQAWLNVTETLTVPEKPVWLIEVTK